MSKLADGRKFSPEFRVVPHSEVDKATSFVLQGNQKTKRSVGPCSCGDVRLKHEPWLKVC